eukprot:SAG25_NODE_800_length_5271_cov_4.461524_7_plen_65_part_00
MPPSSIILGTIVFRALGNQPSPSHAGAPISYLSYINLLDLARSTVLLLQEYYMIVYGTGTDSTI